MEADEPMSLRDVRPVDQDPATRATHVQPEEGDEEPWYIMATFVMERPGMFMGSLPDKTAYSIRLHEVGQQPTVNWYARRSARAACNQRLQYWIDQRTISNVEYYLSKGISYKCGTMVPTTLLGVQVLLDPGVTLFFPTGAPKHGTAEPEPREAITWYRIATMRLARHDEDWLAKSMPLHTMYTVQEEGEKEETMAITWYSRAVARPLCLDYLRSWMEHGLVTDVVYSLADGHTVDTDVLPLPPEGTLLGTLAGVSARGQMRHNPLHTDPTPFASSDAAVAATWENVQFMPLGTDEATLLDQVKTQSIVDLLLSECGIKPRNPANNPTGCMRCVIREVAWQAMPCEHAVLCEPCYWFYTSSSVRDYCPDCYQPVKRFVALDS